jgi:hypothetical protein
MKTPTTRHASRLAIFLLLLASLAACTAPTDGGGASGAPAASEAPAGSAGPEPTKGDYEY